MMRMPARCRLLFSHRFGQPLLIAHASFCGSPSPLALCPTLLPKHIRRHQSAEASPNPSVSPTPFDFDTSNAGATENSATSSRAPSVVAVPSQGQGQRKQSRLPITCPGCGALSQEVASDEAGYYTRSRKAVKTYLRSVQKPGNPAAPLLFASATDNAGSPSFQDEEYQGRGARNESEDGTTQWPELKAFDIPVCDRCHDLIYNSRGTSIAHPTIEAIADSIAESPFSRNHVYHVIDAADFPLSLIPSIFNSLSLARPRSQNRRSQHDFSRRPTLSFIITRSDLLAPTKETVDSLMPYITSVLRQELGRFARDIRLGNVHLVSAKRGWWTTDIKDSIWRRGGGNWMVGKVNVGKSNLFEVLFPKGSGERAPSYTELEQEAQADRLDGERAHILAETDRPLSETSLLPPSQPETAFPILPVVSSLPGTTASPIRLPFGRHKGELIDLPGLARGNLEEFVQPEHRLSLVMTHRPTATQHIIKPGQSLLLGGGLIRITPLLDKSDPSTTLLAYPFVPLNAHVTSTEKAIGAQGQQRQSSIKTILTEGAGEKMRMAGILKLNTDVTRARAGSLLHAGVPLAKLPFRVYSTDVIIEGVGWVELVCQVRRSRRSFSPSFSTDFSNKIVTLEAADSGELVKEPELENSSSHESPGSALSELQSASEEVWTRSRTDSQDLEEMAFEAPRVEVHTPNGAHIGKRIPMGAWLLLEPGRKRKAKKAALGGRPRKPMKGVKKRVKEERRAKEGTAIGGSENG